MVSLMLTLPYAVLANAKQTDYSFFVFKLAPNNDKVS